MRRIPVIAPQAKEQAGKLSIPIDELWTPALLGTDVLVAWYDILEDDSYSQEGDGIKLWKDKSGNGHDLTQTDHSKQPDWIPHMFGHSKNGAVYDGLDDRLSAHNMTIAQPFTVMEIVKTGDSQHHQAATFGGSANDAVLYVSNEYASGRWAMRAGGDPSNVADSGVQAVPDTTYMVVAQFDADNSSISFNGQQKIPMPGIGTFGITGGPNL